ncbi:MAG: YceD family protein [bacterium]
MLLLNLARIRTVQDRIEQVYRPDQFEADEDFGVVAPVSLAFDVFKDNQAFRLVGRARTVLELKCSRCLEPFTVAVDQEFDLRYQPHASNSGEGECEIEEDDLTTAFYENDEIDLGHLMHEQFVLSLPMKPLCEGACRGLCPVCGTNLNRGTCECKPVWEDPRLAALRELRTKN